MPGQTGKVFRPLPGPRPGFCARLTCWGCVRGRLREWEHGTIRENALPDSATAAPGLTGRVRRAAWNSGPDGAGEPTCPELFAPTSLFYVAKKPAAVPRLRCS